MPPKRVHAFAVLVSAVLTLSPDLTQAQTAAEEQLQQRVQELEQKLQRLEGTLDQQTKILEQQSKVLERQSKALEQQSQALEQQSKAAAPIPSPSPVAAQPSNREQALEQRVEQLDQQVCVLDRKRELEQEAAAAKAKETATVTANNKDGFGLRSADGAFQLRLRGLLQADSRTFFESNLNPAPVDNFLIRRARIAFEATLYEKFAFYLQGDFAGTPTLTDGYIDANLWPELRFRFGKFKAPVGLERLQSAAWLEFVERAFPTLLVPDREIGAQVFGDLFKGTLSYQVALVDGAADGARIDNTDSNSSKAVDARIFAHPFKNGDTEALRGLGVGIAYTTGNESGSATTSNLPTFRTPGQQTFFAYSAGAFAAGNHQRLSPQFYYYVGPLGVLGEYVVSEQTVTRATNSQQVRNTAWQLYATWVLTGEDASYRGVFPRRPFDWKARQWGAFEIAARISELQVDDDVFVGSAATRLANPSTSAQKATDFGLGLNWYLNRNIKLQLTYDHTTFQGGAANGQDQEDEDVLLGRVQAQF